MSKFIKIFRDFNTNLPGMTIAVIRFTNFLASYWYLALLLVCLWPFVNWGIVSVLSPSPEVVIPRRLWYCLTWLIIFLIPVFAMVTLYLPLNGLIDSLSPPPPGSLP